MAAAAAAAAVQTISEAGNLHLRHLGTSSAWHHRQPAQLRACHLPYDPGAIMSGAHRRIGGWSVAAARAPGRADHAARRHTVWRRCTQPRLFRLCLRYNALESLRLIDRDAWPILDVVSS